MKQIKAAIAACVLTIAGAMSALAMDSDTLQQNPYRYRVVGTQPGSVLYMDLDSIQAMQTRDMPSSIETISCTMYAETYDDHIDAMTFEQGQLVKQINEYKTVIHADKVEDTYDIEADFQKAYTAKGQSLDSQAEVLCVKNKKDVYIYAHRLISLPKR